MNRKVDLPLITIIVALYNGEKYLRECLDSVLHQDYSNLEIILVDDGSVDSSGQIADEYGRANDKIKVIHQKNMGVSKARNRAIQDSKGEYICIVDQDDCLSENYISYYYGLIRDNNAEIALTPMADKFFGSVHTDIRSDQDKVKVCTGNEAAIEMLYHKIVIAPWNKMISRKLIVENDIKFNTAFFCGEGFAFSIECFFKANRIAVGNKKVYHYRVGHPESGASKFRLSMIHSSIEAQKYIKLLFVNPSDALLKAWYFSNWHTHCDCLNIMVGCGKTKEYQDLYQSIKGVCKKDALCALDAPISISQKVRGILFKISPYFAACIVNFFRLRKFDKNV